MESSTSKNHVDEREEQAKEMDIARARDSLAKSERADDQKNNLPSTKCFSEGQIPCSETKSTVSNTVGEGFQQQELQGHITAAQDNKCENSSQSASSTKSGLVSPSSCSVSSQEHDTKDILKLKEPENVQSRVSNDVSTNDAIHSKMMPQTCLSQPLVIEKVDCSTSQAKSPPGEGPSKPPQSKVKPPPPKIGHRKRSNSLPLQHVLPSSQSPGVQSACPPDIIQSTSSSSSKNKNLRRGKWTVEEEAYVTRVIQDFNNGFLDAPAGTTLRSYLSDKLNCDPMRITKKFTGESCIGKRVFHPAVRCPSNSSSIDKAQSELRELESRWRRRLDMQKREAEKKIAASTAATQAAQAAAAASAPHLHDPTSALIRLHASALPGNRVVVSRTASWLDRANAILSNRRMACPQQSSQGSNQDDVKKELQEIEGLIQEGPIIQKSSELLHQDDYNASEDLLSKRKVSDDRQSKTVGPQHDTTETVTNPAQDIDKCRIDSGDEKRLRKSFSGNNLDMPPSQICADYNVSSGEAEDAASFLGFISSVQKESVAATPASSSSRTK